MAVPKKKSSKTRTRRRWASYVTRMRNKILNRTNMVPCSSCTELKLAHTVCMACGMYNDRQVLDVKKEKKVTKIEA